MPNQLRPGKGAEASILTKMIKPKQTVPSDGHRSNVVIKDCRRNPNGKPVFRFKLKNSQNSSTMQANIRYVKITKEGPEEDLFSEDDLVPKNLDNDFVEPKTKWKKSAAKRLLTEDIVNNLVGPDDLAEDVYMQRPEYSLYDPMKFEQRLKDLIASISGHNDRAEEDLYALEIYLENNDVSHFNHRGEAQWKGSDAYELLMEDLDEGRFEALQGYRNLYDSRPEYWTQYPFEVFRDYVRMEIGTQKYLHTLEVKGKQHKSS